MSTREKLDEFAEINGMNKNQLIGWSIAADFAEWYAEQVKNCSKPAVMHWVAVSERLPEINQHVLVVRTSPNIVTTGYIHKYGHWIWSNLNGSTHKADHIYKVTHWMPLPEPPCA